MIRKVEALSASELRVVLADGAEHSISIEGFEGGERPNKRWWDE